MIITIDGIDRTGKDTLHRYIERLSNFRYVINTRGILTQIAYNLKFDRGYTYNLDEYKNDVIIFLTAEPEDLEVRFKMTGEPKLNSNKTLKEGIEEDLELFNNIVYSLEEQGYIVLKYNTSFVTPYRIALDVIDELKELEKKGKIRI